MDFLFHLFSNSDMLVCVWSYFLTFFNLLQRIWLIYARVCKESFVIDLQLFSFIHDWLFLDLIFDLLYFTFCLWFSWYTRIFVYTRRNTERFIYLILLGNLWWLLWNFQFLLFLLSLLTRTIYFATLIFEFICNWLHPISF